MFETPRPPRDRGPSKDWSLTYLKSVSGIVKIVEMVLSIAGFISAVVFPFQWYGGMGFTSFVCITGFLTSAASFVLHLSNLFPDLMIAYIIELAVYGVFVLFFFIAAILSSVVASQLQGQYGAPSAGAAAFFCFACLVAWIVDTVSLIMTLNEKHHEPPSEPTGPPAVVSTPDAPTY